MTTTLKAPPRRKKTQAPAKLVALSTDRRFVMVGHTVRILSAYDNLRGRYATVTRPDLGEGKVEVELGYGDTARRICYLSRELSNSMQTAPDYEVVAGNDYMLHRGNEECCLIARYARLKVLADRMPPQLASALLKRSERVRCQVRAIQREASVRCAHRLFLLMGVSYCTAIVPYVAVESGVAA